MICLVSFLLIFISSIQAQYNLTPEIDLQTLARWLSHAMSSTCLAVPPARDPPPKWRQYSSVPKYVSFPLFTVLGLCCLPSILSKFYPIAAL